MQNWAAWRQLVTYIEHRIDVEKDVEDEEQEEANFSQMQYLCFFILNLLVDLFQGVVMNPEELEGFGYGRHRGGG